MTGTSHKDILFDDFLDALSEGEGFYLECSNGHPSLPPCRVCSACGDTSLDKSSLSKRGIVAAHTVIHVPPPRFSERAPYVVAIADFDGIELTGHLTGEAVESIENGAEVSATVGRTEQTTERYVEFDLV